MLIVASSRQNGQLVWKDSSVALAFHGLHDNNDLGTSLMNTLEVTKAAKSKWAKIATDEDGRLTWRTT